jgi:hypothetical protein
MPVTREHLALIEQRLDILMSGLKPLPPVLKTYRTESITEAIRNTARDAIPIDSFEVTEETHGWIIKFRIPGREFSLRLAYGERNKKFRVDNYRYMTLEDAAIYMMEYVEKQHILQALRTTAPDTIPIKDVQVKQTERHRWDIYMGTIRHTSLFGLAYRKDAIPFQVDYGWKRYTTHDNLEDTATHLWKLIEKTIPKDSTETKLLYGMAKLGQTEDIKVETLNKTQWTISIITPRNTAVSFRLDYDTDNMQFTVNDFKGTFYDVKDYMWSEAEKYKY